MIPKYLAGAEVLFEGKRFSVVRPMGQAREVIVHPGAVVILPLLDDSTVAMIRNQRVAVGQTLWELPAGTLEAGEPPEVCAPRELIEETGYRAARMRKLLSFFSSPGICTERMHVFVAEGLEHVGQDLDEGERIDVEPVALSEALRMVRDNRIEDAKSVAALLYYQAFAKDGA
jgi:ADP-ribose pyrophosphatase